jgi:hypothetical protein
MVAICCASQNSYIVQYSSVLKLFSQLIFSLYLTIHFIKKIKFIIDFVMIFYH